MNLHQAIWRHLPFSAGLADEALAASEGLVAGLAGTLRPAARWYTVPRLALVLGAGQRPDEVDSAALAAAGVTLHKRASGGTAVLFGPGLLMQDIALPLEHPLYRLDVSESYAWLGATWAAALDEFGLTAELVAVPTARADTAATDVRVRRACFGGRSPYEVLVGGRKLVGFAQLRRRAGVLFQVGLYTHWLGAELVALLPLTAEERAATITALAQRVVGLAELLPATPDPAVLMGAFARALAHRYGVTLESVPWHPDELTVTRATLPRYAPI